MGFLCCVLACMFGIRIATLDSHRSVGDGDLQLLFPIGQQVFPQLSPSPQRLQPPVVLPVLSFLVLHEAFSHLLVDDLPRLTLPRQAVE